MILTVDPNFLGHPSNDPCFEGETEKEKPSTQKYRLPKETLQKPMEQLKLLPLTMKVVGSHDGMVRW